MFLLVLLLLLLLMLLLVLLVLKVLQDQLVLKVLQDQVEQQVLRVHKVMMETLVEQLLNINSLQIHQIQIQVQVN